MPSNLSPKNSIHLILFFICSIFLLACTEEIIEKEGALGKEATAQEYQKALEDALGDVSIGNSEVGYSVTYENNQRVELGPVVRTELFTHSLIGIKIDPTSVRFVLFKDFYEFDPMHGHIINEYHKELPPLIFSRNQFQSSSLSDACDGKNEKDSAGNEYDCIKIFNLKSVKKIVPPPPAVSAKPNCMGLPNCMLNVQHITYDEVKWRAGKAVDKINISYEIAKEIPDLIYIANSDGRVVGYMPPVLSACQRGHIKLNNTDAIVSLCTVLKDFNNIKTE